jgi:cytochrome oxidase Cu insertion factor (SCO1/SenC/PrrC family)
MIGRAAVTAALSALAVACAACGKGDPAIAPPGPRIGQPINAPLPATISNAVLVSSSGSRFTLASLRGKVVVVSDVMTLCQESCPLDTADVVAAARAATRNGLSKKIVFLSITIDPNRDTPVQLTAYRRQFAPAPSDWITATGAPRTLHAFWKAFGVYIKRVPDQPPVPHNWRTGKPLTYDLTHSDEIFFLDQHGHERFVLDGVPHLAPGTTIPPTLNKFLDAKGHQNVTSPSKLAWTLPQELRVLSWLSGKHIR